MKKSPFLLRYMVYLTALLLLSFLLPIRYGIPYPKPLEPTFKPNVKREYGETIAATQPGIVLVGDSVLYLGVDQHALSDLLEVETYAIGIPGSGSAVWYLILKNVILESVPRPAYVLIVFRDTMLTVPSYRTTGRYFVVVDDFAGRNEPLVSQLAYINQMSAVERLAEQYFPLYSARWEIRRGLDHYIRYTTPSVLLGCTVECTDEAINAIFGKDRVNVTALNQAVEDAGRTLYAPQVMDFDEQVERSFLPAMIKLARENDITLIFVRTRTLDFPEAASEPRALREYIESLGTYLAGQPNVYFLDFAHHPKILDSYFFDTIHFTEEGKSVFTGLLAQELSPILE